MREEILDSIGTIDDDMVERVGRLRQQKRKRRLARPWLAAAVSLCLVAAGVAGVGSMMKHLGGKGGAGGGNEELTYLSYAGPVFPLAANESLPEVTVYRRTEYDFTPYGNQKSECIVTDRYQLMNEGDDDYTVTLSYPFVGDLYSTVENIPTLTIDGGKVPGELHIDAFWNSQPDRNELSGEFDSWQDCQRLFDAAGQKLIYAELPELDQTVIVYELSNPNGVFAEPEEAATLNMEFRMDYDRTKVLTYGFNGASCDIEAGTGARHTELFPGQEYGGQAWMIVLGEDIGEYSLKTYADGSLEQLVEDTGAVAARYETSLREVLDQLAGRYWNAWKQNRQESEPERQYPEVSEAVFAALAAEGLNEYEVFTGKSINDWWEGSLEEIFNQAMNRQRLLYVTAEVTIPAHTTVDVAAQMVKPASRNFVGGRKNQDGYDLMTQMGTVLNITEQKAAIAGAEQIEIVRQNFGFAPEEGVTEVVLDAGQEHYWMEVRRKE